MEPTQLLCTRFSLEKGWKSLQEFAMSCTQDERLNRGEQTRLGEICLFLHLWLLQQPLVPLWPGTCILSSQILPLIRGLHEGLIEGVLLCSLVPNLPLSAKPDLAGEDEN